MFVNNFKILQCLVDNECKNSICQIKAKFLREHYVAHYWAKEENREVQCCRQNSDTVYSNQVFYTKLECAENFDEVYKGMNLPTIENYDAPVDLVFHDCSDYSSGNSSSASSVENATISEKSGVDDGKKNKIQFETVDLT
jgi:hypothetical protein